MLSRKEKIREREKMRDREIVRLEIDNREMRRGMEEARGRENE